MRLSASGGLPPNHDVENACRLALQQALEMLAQAMEVRQTQPKTFVEAWQNRRDENGRWKPMVQWWHTREREWFAEFTDEIASPDSLNKFDLSIGINSAALSKVARGADTNELELQFHAAAKAWIKLRVQSGTAPEFLDRWLDEGWPVAESSPGVRIKLFEAWCLFFQEHLKSDESVFHNLATDWLGAIDDRLANLKLPPDGFDDWLQTQLGNHAQLLTDLHQSVMGMALHVDEIRSQAGRLLSLLVTFQDKDAANLDEIFSALDNLQSKHSTTHRKLDQSAGKQEEMLKLQRATLERLDAVIREDAQFTTLQQGDCIDQSLIREPSQLLEMDGANRIGHLLGRGTEKGQLTRTWRDFSRPQATNVLSLVAMGGIGKTSLIIEWLRDLQASGWPDVEAFFDWSFYSQGTDCQSEANSGTFLDECLRHFGRADIANSSDGPVTKARKLADEIVNHRTLLILDGVEPLQHPKRKQMEGRFRDSGLKALLRALAGNSKFDGLCIVTTRVELFDLAGFRGFRERKLEPLRVRDGAKLLHSAGANKAGAQDNIDTEDRLLADAARDCQGHALTLQLLGSYLKHAHGGDIRLRGQIDWSVMIEDELEGHTFRVMDAYQHWFAEKGDVGQQQMAAVRLLGLFNRPADSGCLNALRTAKAIPGLTDAIHADILPRKRWNILLSTLETDHGLLSITWSGGGDVKTVDAHPLIREYFAIQLRGDTEGQTPVANAWIEGHRILFEYLCNTTPYRPDTLSELQPLYQSIAHGCHAGLQQVTCDAVYIDRILRGMGSGDFYSMNKLGATGADLGAIACFFDDPWSHLSGNLSAEAKSWLLGFAASNLRRLGRLTEALEPLRVGLKMDVARKDWKNSAISSLNLSELELTLGDTAAAVAATEESVNYANLSNEINWIIVSVATHGEALHQAGNRKAAIRLFEQAEALQAKIQPQYKSLYSTRGYHFGDALLSAAECEAWRSSIMVGHGSDAPHHREVAPPTEPVQQEPFVSECDNVIERARQWIEWRTPNISLLDIALIDLTIARCGWYRFLFNLADNTTSRSSTLEPLIDIPQSTLDHVNAAVNGLVDSGVSNYIPVGLLLRAWIQYFANDRDGCIADLNEVQEIAERGPMPLFLVDLYLTRARLFGRASAVNATPDEYPSGHTARHDLDEAERLIDDCGYHRRDEELADAGRALGLTVE